MNDYIHDKVVKWFYDHEELLIAIMNKTPYQSDGWDYEIEVVNEFLTTEQRCYCGDIYTLGVIHRDDGPCHYPEHKEPKPKQGPVAFPRQAGKNTWTVDTAFIWRVKHTIDPDTPNDFTPSEEQIETVLLALEKIPSNLYTTPPQRKPLVSLSDEDIERIAKKARSKDHAITLAIRELKEKNT